MKRDFSEEARSKMLGLIDQVEGSKWCDFTDKIGDTWYGFEEWTGSLNIRNYMSNVDAYHKIVIDKNNTSKQQINQIFDKVQSVDATYGQILSNIEANLKKWQDYTDRLSQIVDPSNGKFTPRAMEASLDEVLKDIAKTNVDRVKDQLVQDIDGELIFNEELLYEYIQKDPAEMTPEEMQAVLEVIQQLKDTVAFYESAATIGNDKISASFLNRVLWVSETDRYSSFSEISAHYNDIYVKVLESFIKCDKDSATFGSAVVKVTNGEHEVSLMGLEGSVDISKLFGSTSVAAYLGKWKTEHSEHYFSKLEAYEKRSFSGGFSFKDLNDNTKKYNDSLEKWLKDKGYYKKDGEKRYWDDVNGVEISEDEAPEFLDPTFTVAEFGDKIGKEYHLYQGSFDVGDKGKIDVVVGQAEAHAGISAGLYYFAEDGSRHFNPGVKAEIGTSVTAFDASWNQQWVGNEMLGINSDVNVTAGKAEAKADMEAYFFDKNGNLDIQFGAGASAEAIAAEAKGSVGVNVLGGEVGVSAGVNFGVGAHANVGYRDGVFKFDVGASVGLGFSLDLEVDVGGMVDTVCDKASSAWNSLKSGWDSLWD